MKKLLGSKGGKGFTLHQLLLIINAFVYVCSRWKLNHSISALSERGYYRGTYYVVNLNHCSYVNVIPTIYILIPV